MGKKGFGSKRRTVLQLDDGPRKQPTFGLGYKASDNAPPGDGSANALSGLMSQYAQDSGSDSGSDNEASPASSTHVDAVVATSHQSKSSHGLPYQMFVAATDTFLPNQPDSADSAPAPKQLKVVAESTSHQLKSATEQSKAPADDIDVKLLDFLAEIESIESKKESLNDEGIDGVPLPSDSTVTLCKEQSTESSHIAAASDDDDDFKLSKPKEPVPKWQQCLDEETQCYYYWHVDTNEVTWEIPAEYSQYLLRYAEYEKARAHYDVELAAWKAAHPNRKVKTAKKKHRRHAKKTENMCIPIVSYPPDEDSSEVQGPVHGPSCGPPLPLIGPSLPESVPSAPLRHGPPDAPNNAAHADRKKVNRSAQDAESSGDAANGSIVTSACDSSTVVHSVVKPSNATSKDTKAKAIVTNRSTDESEHSSTVTASEEGDIGTLKALHEKFVRRSAKAKDQHGAHGASSNLLNGNHSPVEHTTTGGDETADTKMQCVDGDRSDVDHGSVAEPSQVAAMVDDDDSFVQQMLEEPVFVRYDYVNKKYESCEDVAEPTDIGADDIDNELDRALEQTAHVDVMAGHTTTTANHEGANNKRKAVEEIPGHMPMKKVKSMLECSSTCSMLQQPIKDDVKKKVNELTEVADLASTVTDKLDFLEVNCADLSKLQILLLQIETRIEDWRAGALSTERLLTKLRESCATLRQYELSATPPGWSCHWHRYELLRFYGARG